MNEDIKRHHELIHELSELANGLEPWYSIDKVKAYGVYVWSKTDWWGENLFDIYEDEVCYYVKDHKIPDEAWSVIHQIQAKIREIWEYVDAHVDAFPNGKWLVAAREECKEE